MKKYISHFSLLLLLSGFAQIALGSENEEKGKEKLAEVKVLTSGDEHVTSLTQALEHLQKIKAEQDAETTTFIDPTIAPLCEKMKKLATEEDSDPDSEGSEKLSEFRNRVAKVRRTLLKASRHAKDEDTTKLFKVMKKLNRRVDKLFEEDLDPNKKSNRTLTSNTHHPAFVYLVEIAGRLAKDNTANDLFIDRAYSLHKALTTLPTE